MKQLFLLIIPSILFVSCKKDGDVSNNFHGCRIAEINTTHQSGTQIAQYEYNSIGQLIAMKSGSNYSKIYSYLNGIKIIKTSSPGNLQIDTIVLDDQNRVQFIKTKWTYGNYSTANYSYDANGLLTKIDYEPGTDHYYTWMDGDLIVDSSDGNTHYFEYYKDTLSSYTQTGFDLFAPNPLASKHLLKSDSGSIPSAHYYYKLDEKNKVIADSVCYPSWWISSRYSYDCRQ